MEKVMSDISNGSGSYELVISESPVPDSVDSNKFKRKEPARSGHIPYILNGLLYEIQSQEGENVTVKCCNCPPDRVYRGSVRSTGNFHMHIKRRHPDLMGKLHEMKVTALLERRDRIMKNRKSAPRSNNNGKISVAKRPIPFQQPELDLIQTHNLKIKTAFQRHQLQKQETQQNNWNGAPLVIPITKPPNETNEPINYSLKETQNKVKENESKKMVVEIAECVEINRQPLQDLEDAQTPNSQMLVLEQERITPLVNSEVENITGSTPQRNVCIYDNHFSIDNINHRNTVAIVKNEMLTSEQALDLSMQSSRINSTGTALTYPGTNGSGTTPNLKWNQLLMQVETSLHDIQREMHTRNQIETNRIFLDIAKFKYLHPGFNFNC